MREEIEKRRAEAAERKKQMEEEESAKPTFAINNKGSSKVSFRSGLGLGLGLIHIYFILLPSLKPKSVASSHIWVQKLKREKKKTDFRIICFPSDIIRKMSVDEDKSGRLCWVPLKYGSGQTPARR